MKKIVNLIKLKYIKKFNPHRYESMLLEDKYLKSLKVGNDLFKNLIDEKETYSLKHAGKIGDIIYALPMMRALAYKCKSKKVKLYIELKNNNGKIFKNHSVGPVLLTSEIFNSLLPLLEKQIYIESVSIYSGEEIDFDLDDFRKCLVYFSRGSLSKYYQYVIPIDIDLETPYLNVEPNYMANESILVNRTERYRMPNLNYKYLNTYRSVYFVGLEHEYKELKNDIPKIEWIETKNHLELAEVIAGAKLFLGNQSSSFAIAEALKTKRILETDLINPDVIPVGGQSIQCCFQNQLEYATKCFYKSND